MTKARRQHLIGRLLEEHAVTNQAKLVDLLELDDISATQATVSRDLDDLGAVKVRVPGGETVYAIPEHPAHRPVAPEDHLRRVLSDWVVDVLSSRNIVLLRTPPGSAHVVAAALDRAGLSEVLGTVAGDDSVIVVVVEAVAGSLVAARLSDLAGLQPRRSRVPSNAEPSDDQPLRR